MATTLNLDDDSLERAANTWRALNEMLDRYTGQVPTPVSTYVWQLGVDLGLERGFERTSLARSAWNSAATPEREPSAAERAQERGRR